MAGIGELIATLGVDNAPWKKGLKGANTSLGGFASKAKKQLGAVAIAMGAAFGAKATISAAREQAAAGNKLRAVLAATGNAAGMSAEEMENYAAELQQVTNYGDEATISSMAVLSTFTQIKGDVFKDAIKSAQDMSAALGTPMQGAIIQIGKALNDPIRGMSALAETGIMFTDSQRAQITNLQKSGDMMGAQSVILAELQGEFGGVAESMANPMSQAMNAIGDVAEAVGFLLLPMINVVAEAIIDLGEGATQYTDDFKAVGESLGNALESAMPTIKEMFNVLVDGVKTLKIMHDWIGAPFSSGPAEAIDEQTKAFQSATQAAGLHASAIKVSTDELKKMETASTSLTKIMDGWKTPVGQLNTKLAEFRQTLEDTGNTHLDIESLSKEFIRAESGFTQSLRDTNDELRILRGEATKTTIELERMKEMGVSDQDLGHLANRIGEQQALEEKKKAEEAKKKSVADQIKKNADLLKAKTEQMKSEAEAVMATIRSPEEKIKKEAERLKKLVQGGFLDFKDGKEALEKFTKDTKDAESGGDKEQGFAGVVQQGTAEAFSATVKAMTGGGAELKEAKEQTKAIKDLPKHLARQLARNQKLAGREVQPV